MCPVILQNVKYENALFGLLGEREGRKRKKRGKEEEEENDHTITTDRCLC